MKLVPITIAAAIVLTGCGESATPLSSDAGHGAPHSANRGAGPPEDVTLCHVTDDGDTMTMTVPENTVDVHLAHGDALGPCDACAPEPSVDPDGCSPDLLLRTPDQVIVDLRAARAAGDWTAFACNYHPDAFVIDDQGVLIGRTEIVAAAQSLVDLFDGVLPVITQADFIWEDVVRELYTIDAGWVVIPDGTSTYIVENGMVTRQTTHGIIEFTGPPPDAQ